MVSKIFYFHPYLGKIPNLTNIFQMGWNHQLESHLQFSSKPGHGHLYMSVFHRWFFNTQNETQPAFLKLRAFSLVRQVTLVSPSSAERDEGPRQQRFEVMNWSYLDQTTEGIWPWPFFFGTLVMFMTWLGMIEVYIYISLVSSGSEELEGLEVAHVLDFGWIYFWGDFVLWILRW